MLTLLKILLHQSEFTNFNLAGGNNANQGFITLVCHGEHFSVFLEGSHAFLFKAIPYGG